MRWWQQWYGGSALSLLCVLWLVGCAVDQGKIYVKDGIQYGVTSSQIWRGRWWNYYERGLSYAVGEFWSEAIADLQQALKQRDEDLRRARTYGFHFIDYFPHRELGVVYYRLGRYPDAIRELETSLKTVDTAKAKFYLNRARRDHLQQTQGDTLPPQLQVDSPRDGLLTRQFTLAIVGRAYDDTSVATLTINGHAQFIELAEPHLSFRHEIQLQDGANTIEIVAGDLVGQLTRQQRTVILDRRGPLLSVAHIEYLTNQRVRLHGLLSDQSGIVRFVLAGGLLALQGGTAWEFHEEVLLPPNTATVPFEAEDAAGNVTRGDIALTPLASALPGVREGKPVLHQMPHWAVLEQTTVVTDLPTWHVAPQLMVQRSESARPIIKLSSLEDREIVYDDTVYLEGQVIATRLITAFTVNGDSLWRQKSQQLFFGQQVLLQAGENTFALEAADEAGSTTQRHLVISRETRQVRRVGSRLRTILMPLEQKGTLSAMAQTVYDNLFNVLVNQRRFDFVERQQLDAILQELKLSQTALVEPSTAAKVGKLAAAEGMLIGTVTETSRALEVFTRFVDVETSAVLAAADVYGEDMTLGSLRALIEGLAWKFQRHFPLVEGAVIDKKGTKLLIDLANGHGVKQGMKLIVFRAGQEIQHPRTGRTLRRPETILGEAQITAVSDDLSEAALVLSTKQGEIQETDMVITK